MLSTALAENVGILRSIIEMSFNESSIVAPTFSSNRDVCLSKQRAHMMALGLSRRSLQLVQFGSMRWTREDTLRWGLVDLSLFAAEKDDRRAPQPVITGRRVYSVFYSFGDS